MSSNIFWDLLVLIDIFIFISQSFKQKTSAKNLVLTNAKKVSWE